MNKRPPKSFPIPENVTFDKSECYFFDFNLSRNARRIEYGRKGITFF